MLKLTKTAKIAFWLFHGNGSEIYFLIAISLHVDLRSNRVGSLRKNYFLTLRANAKKLPGPALKSGEINSCRLSPPINRHGDMKLEANNSIQF